MSQLPDTQGTVTVDSERLRSWFFMLERTVNQGGAGVETTTWLMGEIHETLMPCPNCGEVGGLSHTVDAKGELWGCDRCDARWR